jgi:hypothetical protein
MPTQVAIPLIYPVSIDLFVFFGYNPSVISGSLPDAGTNKEGTKWYLKK